MGSALALNHGNGTLRGQGHLGISRYGSRLLQDFKPANSALRCVTDADHSGFSIGRDTAGNNVSHVSAEGVNGHNKTSSVAVQSTYTDELKMFCPKTHKILSSSLHVAGSLKVPLADALRRATKGMRNAAKSIATIADRHENTAKNWLRAECEMSATELVRLMREFDEVADLVLTASGRKDGQLSSAQKDAMRRLLGE